MVKDANKPKGKMTSYAFFVQTCREEHKKKHPGESVVFAEFSRKCADKWKDMEAPEKKRFEEMAQKDKKRYEAEMKNYNPPPGDDVKGKRKAKKTKDPNAPKRAMSGFFFFSGEERANVKAANPTFTIGDIAKNLGKQWEKITDKSRYELMAKKDRARYEKEMEIFRRNSTSASPNKKPKMSGKAAAAAAAAQAQAERSEEDDDEEEEEEEDEEEEEEDDEEDDE